jgi:hypothetical protein
MPVHHGSRSDQDERLPPPGPEPSQRNPKQLVQGSQSTARPLRVQSQQLLTQRQVFEDEVLPGTESADHPPEEMPERHDHGKNLSGTVRIELSPSHTFRGRTTFWRHTALTFPETLQPAGPGQCGGFWRRLEVPGAGLTGYDTSCDPSCDKPALRCRQVFLEARRSDSSATKSSCFRGNHRE